MVAVDASALLAYLRNEPGSQKVKQALDDGATCSAANWSEVIQKTLQRGDDWNAAQQVLGAFDLVIEPVTREDAELAASMWAGRPSLSLGDRLCLALAQRLGVIALTADSAWGESDTVEQIR